MMCQAASFLAHAGFVCGIPTDHRPVADKIIPQNCPAALESIQKIRIGAAAHSSIIPTPKAAYNWSWANRNVTPDRLAFTSGIVVQFIRCS